MAHTPYEKTVFVNDTAPAISAANLNKQEDELEYLDNSVSNLNIQVAEQIVPEKTTFAHTVNFLDVSECVVGKRRPDSIYQSTTLDDLINDANFVTSKIYPCKPGEKYTLNKQGYPSNITLFMGDANKNAYGLQKYDDNKVQNADGTYTVTIPSGVYYFRWCFTINTTGWSDDGWKTKAMITKGTSLPSEFVGNRVEIDGVNITELRTDVDAIEADVYELLYADKPILFTGSQLGRYVIKSGLSVGDTFDKESNAYRYLYSTPIKKGNYWILNCGNLNNYSVWCVVDKNEKVVAISDTGVANTDSLNCKINVPDDGVKLYWDVTQPKSIIIRDSDKFELIKGDENVVATSDIVKSNATVVDNNINLDGHKCIFANIQTSGYIQFPLTSGRYINAGVWIKASYNEASKVSSITVAQIDNNTSYGDKIVPKDRLKTEEWVFVGTSALARSAITGLRITPTFETGETSVNLIVCPVVYTDFFSKPYAIINFDNAWQASEDCGAYDLLISNNIPFTITGSLDKVDATTKNKLIGACDKGLLEIGTYGNEDYSGTRYPINNTVNMAEASENMFSLLSIKHTDGIDTVSFGPANHILTQTIMRTLKDFDYKIVRVYGDSYITNAKYQKGFVCITETHTGLAQNNLLIGSNVDLGVIGMFAHGVSSNPSAEEDPSLYTSYTSFSGMIATLQKAISLGCIEPITMREFVEQMK